MEKKFKLNDGSKTFVERNTLLEPANNSSALQNDADEIREVSVQLSQIKKKHDEAKKLSNQMQDRLDKVRKDIEVVGVQETVAEGPVLQVSSRLEQLREHLNETQKRLEEEQLTQSTYHHMLKRMECDFIATKLKTSDNEGSMKSKQALLDFEGGKQRQSKEQRLQSKCIFDQLMRNIEKEQRDRQERIIELQKCIKNKEESVQRRIERQRRNAEIAEKAANENKDSSELKMRENLYVQKLWNTFMRKKMEKEMHNSQAIDDAFKAIKTATGVNDVQEMVRKFLTREQTYSQLLVTVSESESKIDKLKKENEELSGRLHDLKLDTNAGDKAKGAAALDSDADILAMKRDLDEVCGGYNKLNERFKGVNIVNDQVSSWAKRVYSKFGLLTEDPVFQEQPDDLPKVFAAMEAVSSRELEAISKQREVEGEDQIEYAEVFNDFATEDFVNKNIRVRPVSGMNDETRDGRQSNVSRGVGEGATEDQEDNFNKMANLELEGQRKDIKKILQKKLDDAAKKAAAEAAKKKKVE